MLANHTEAAASWPHAVYISRHSPLTAYFSHLTTHFSHLTIPLTFHLSLLTLHPPPYPLPPQQLLVQKKNFTPASMPF